MRRIMSLASPYANPELATQTADLQWAVQPIANYSLPLDKVAQSLMHNQNIDDE